MLSRRHRIALGSVGALVLTVALVAAVVRGRGVAALVLAVVVLVEVAALLVAVRNRPAPPLTLERLPRLRNRAAAVTGVLLVLAVTCLAVAPSRPEPTLLLVAAVAVLLAAVCAGVITFRVGRMVRRGEIPQKVLDRDADLRRRREL